MSVINLTTYGGAKSMPTEVSTSDSVHFNCSAYTLMTQQFAKGMRVSFGCLVVLSRFVVVTKQSTSRTSSLYHIATS